MCALRRSRASTLSSTGIAVERDLQAVGIRYLFLGEALGGRPEGDRFYDHEGHVLYGRIAESRRFESGLSPPGRAGRNTPG